MTAQQLKNSILQMAVQGKLVPQNPNDEPASVLLERIRKEKEKLIKEGKIKREKNPSVIFRGADNTPYEKVGSEVRSLADEVPFDIPESWEWVRIKDVFQIEMGQSPEGSSVNEIGDGIEFHQGKVYFGKETILQSPQCTNAPTKYAERGSVLLCVRAPVGKVNKTDRMICIGRGLCALKPLGNISTDFAFHLMETFEDTFVKQATGTTFIAITGEVIKNQLVPLPPLEEQKRILDRIKVLLPLVEEYGCAYLKHSQLEKSFPDQLKKSILQTAVQGKLVPQDPNDEPASILLERIHAEKEKLIATGKIKRDKNESVIFRRDNSHYEKLGSEELCIDDEIPFEIPDSWEWVRLREIVSKEIKRGKSPKYSVNGKTLVFAQKCNVKAGGIDLTLAKYLDDSTFNSYPVDEYMSSDDIVVNSTGNGTLGRVGYFQETDRIGNGEVVPDSHVTIVRVLSSIEPRYIYNVLKYYQPILEKQGEGSTNQTELKPAAISSLIVPIPPRTEQQRIVNALDNALEMIKQL